MKPFLKRKTYGRFIALWIIVLFFAGNIEECMAGAWTFPKGRMYCKLALNKYHTDESFNENGNEIDYPDSGEFQDMNISYYMEYGLSDKLSVIFSTAYKYLEKEDDNRKTDYYGLSDMDLGIKYRFHESGIGVFSVQGLIKIPEAYDEEDTLMPGSGQYDFECRLLYGRSLYPMIPGYVNIESGYRVRDKDPSDEFRLLAEAGFDLTEKIYGRLKYDAIIGMGNEDDGISKSGNPSASFDYDLGKIDAAVGYKFRKKWGLEIGTVQEISGKNVSKGVTYSIALFFLN